MAAPLAREPVVTAEGLQWTRARPPPRAAGGQGLVVVPSPVREKPPNSAMPWPSAWA
jgi:hypothetical protein